MEERTAAQRFPSKVDVWLIAVLVLTPLPGIGIAVTAAIAGDLSTALVGVGTTLAVLALYFAVVWPVVYLVDGEALVIRSGRMRQRTPLADITRIRRSRNILASPALSLDRLRIDRSRGAYLLLSPADRAGFARAILERAPQVDVAPDVLGGPPSSR